MEEDGVLYPIDGALLSAGCWKRQVRNDVSAEHERRVCLHRCRMAEEV